MSTETDSTNTEDLTPVKEEVFDIDDELVKKSLESGVDLRDYSASIETQLRGVGKIVSF